MSDDGAGAEAVVALLALVDARRVGRVGHVDDDRHVGLEENAVVIAPPKVISSCATAHATTSPGAPPASATSRAASSATKQPSRLSIARDAKRPGAQLDRLAGDDRPVADAHPRARLVAVLGADVDVQLLELGRLLALLGLEQVDRLLAHHAEDHPVAGVQRDALADEVHRVPAADAAEPQEALVVDVRDDQADLVDVADHGQTRAVARAGDAGDRRAEQVAAHVLGERAGGGLPGGGGGALAAGRAGRGEQRAQVVGERHAEEPESRSWRRT